MEKCVLCGEKAELNDQGICPECKQRIHSEVEDAAFMPHKAVKRKRNWIPYAILGAIAVILFIVHWPTALFYLMGVSFVLGIKKFRRSKKVSIASFIVFAVLASGLIYGWSNPANEQITQQDIVDQAQVSIIDGHKDINVVPKIYDAHISKAGNRTYEVTGTMNATQGGFIYEIEAIIEVSPDNTKIRTDQTNIRCIN